MKSLLFLVTLFLCIMLGGCEDEYSPYTEKGRANRAKVEKWGQELHKKWGEEAKKENEIINKLIGKKKNNGLYNEDSGWDGGPAYSRRCPECNTITHIHNTRKIIRNGKRYDLMRCADCGYIERFKEFECPYSKGETTSIPYKEGAKLWKAKDFAKDHVGYRKDGSSFRRRDAKYK